MFEERPSPVVASAASARKLPRMALLALLVIFIIPGLLAHMKDELQEAMPEWQIITGTIEACQIPEFLKQG